MMDPPRFMVDAQAGSLLFNGPIHHPGGQITLGHQFSTGDITIAGGISASVLAKFGTGTTTLSSLANLLFSLAIGEGDFELGGPNLISDPVSLKIAGGSTFSTAGFSERVSALMIDSAPTYVPSSPTTGTIDFGDGASVLQFNHADGWAAGTTLRLENWSGLAGGEGMDQIFVGSSSSGLSSDLLSRVFFQDPDGWAPGRYSAGILPTGELVPVPEPREVGLAVGLVLLGFGVLRSHQRRASLHSCSRARG